jgi:hypothetical protein
MSDAQAGVVFIFAGVSFMAEGLCQSLYLGFPWEALRPLR